MGRASRRWIGVGVMACSYAVGALACSSATDGNSSSDGGPEQADATAIDARSDGSEQTDVTLDSRSDVAANDAADAEAGDASNAGDASDADALNANDADADAADAPDVIGICQAPSCTANPVDGGYGTCSCTRTNVTHDYGMVCDGTNCTCTKDSVTAIAAGTNPFNQQMISPEPCTSDSHAAYIMNKYCGGCF